MTAIGVVAVAMMMAAAPVGESFQDQMREAIRRHDGGDYAGAIAIYRSLLKDHPHEPNVVYELSLSMMMGKSPPEEQIAFLEAEIKSKAPQLPQLYVSPASWRWNPTPSAARWPPSSSGRR